MEVLDNIESSYWIFISLVAITLIARVGLQVVRKKKA